MRIATFGHDGCTQVGLVSPDGLQLHMLDLSPDAASLGAQTLIEAAAAGRPLPATVGRVIALAEVQLVAPPPRPRRNLFCVDRNYHAHANELRETLFKGNNPDAQAWPIVFTKVAECVVGPDAEVRLPGPISGQIDYEAELAVVIGCGGRNIGRDDAMAHVFGYTIVNDVTARDVQMRHGQWGLGKSFDTFCPMGPWIVSADALDGNATRVRLWVTPAGGASELRQDALTSDLIFDIRTLIEAWPTPWPARWPRRWGVS